MSQSVLQLVLNWVLDQIILFFITFLNVLDDVSYLHLIAHYVATKGVGVTSHLT